MEHEQVDGVRISLHVVPSTTDLDNLVEGIKEIAASDYFSK